MSLTTRSTASVLVRLLFVAFIIGLIFTPNLRTSHAEFSSPKTAFANKWLAAELTEQRILTYTATPVPAGQENLFTLRLGGDHLELSDSRTGVILCSQPLVATSGVLVQGANGKTNDTLTVD
jgi:hypothetical protein